jgi:hypothetical protein
MPQKAHERHTFDVTAVMAYDRSSASCPAAPRGGHKDSAPDAPLGERRRFYHEAWGLAHAERV